MPLRRPLSTREADIVESYWGFEGWSGVRHLLPGRTRAEVVGHARAAGVTLGHGERFCRRSRR